jgi:hypothetical protein
MPCLLRYASFAGIRDAVLAALALPLSLAFAMPCLLRYASFAGIRDAVFAAQALPLCGAAPTFLCSGKEK